MRAADILDSGITSRVSWICRKAASRMGHRPREALRTTIYLKSMTQVYTISITQLKCEQLRKVDEGIFEQGR